MDGDQQARHCEQCERTVFDLSQMTADSAVELLQAKSFKVCARMQIDTNGNVMTRDQIKSIKPRRTWWRMASRAASLIGALSLFACNRQPDPPQVMGDVCPPEQPAVQQVTPQPATQKQIMGEVSHIMGDIAVEPTSVEPDSREPESTH